MILIFEGQNWFYSFEVSVWHPRIQFVSQWYWELEKNKDSFKVKFWKNDRLNYPLLVGQTNTKGLKFKTEKWLAIKDSGG